jgi:hypothetical protein
MELIEAERKSRVLTKAQFGCLRDAYTLNVTRGCEFLCVYCYARGYPGASFSGEVHLYRNLPEKLAGELDNPRRRSVMDWVVFNTASDSFQTHPMVLDITLDQGMDSQPIHPAFLPLPWPGRCENRPGVDVLTISRSFRTTRCYGGRASPKYREAERSGDRS